MKVYYSTFEATEQHYKDVCDAKLLATIVLGDPVDCDSFCHLF